MIRTLTILSISLATCLCADRRDDDVTGGPGDGSGQGPDTHGTGSGGQNQAIYFPADNNPADYVINEDEFNAYKWAWRLNQDWPDTGSKISIDEASLSGAIYFGHEGAYHVQYVDGIPVFVPGAAPEPNNSGSNTDSTSIIAIGPVPAKITIEVDPPEEAIAYCIEERVPDGWIFWNSNGTYSESDNTVRWGPAPAGYTLLEYELFSQLGEREPGGFDGTISYDGESQPLTSHTSEPFYGDSFSNWLWDDEAPVESSELWAFALLGSPDADYQSVYPEFKHVFANNEHFITTKLYRYKWTDDIVFEFQYSTNLDDWYPIVDATMTRDDDYNSDVFAFDVMIPCETARAEPRFYRLEIRHEPVEDW